MDEEFENQVSLQGLRVFSEDSLSPQVAGDLTDSQLVAMVSQPTPSSADKRLDPPSSSTPILKRGTEFDLRREVE